MEKVEERAAKFDRAHTPKRLEQHLAVWERLSTGAEEKIARQLYRGKSNFGKPGTP